MIYLDNGATSFHKPIEVYKGVLRGMRSCANPGRGGYPTALYASRQMLICRELAGKLFDCKPDCVAFTASCTHGLNIAIRSLLKPGGKVIISGFEHNAVTRPLKALSASVTVVGKTLFDWEGILKELEAALKKGTDLAVFTHVSNVFGYILPIEQMAMLCRSYGVPFIIDAAQSAGVLPVSLEKLGADFIAMPGHKGLLGPQGTGMLLCASKSQPLLYGGTGSNSASFDMPDFLPDRLEAGTPNVPGICGLAEGIRYVLRRGTENIYLNANEQLKVCEKAMKELGIRSYFGAHQATSFSFLMKEDCELTAQKLADAGIAVRAGLHCAPLAHESAGTLQTGTIRVSFGHDASFTQSQKLINTLRNLRRAEKFSE